MKKIPYEELQLGQVLGTGTVGTVYLASLAPDASSKAFVDLDEFAVKILRESISDNVLIRQRFRREMDILDRLQHPHIIRYLGGGEHDGQLYFAMELVTGGNIRGLLERFERLSWQEAASVGRQVCSALQHAHNFGIIHRDLKPSNLFLDAEAQIKLGDFGIARDIHSPDLCSKGMTVGTHAYMSPEQITGNENLDEKADLYSLGCVLFELLTGRPPFENPQMERLFEQHLHQPPPRVDHFVNDVPPAFVDLVDQLLRKSPAERPFNARSVQGVLQELLASRGTRSQGRPATELAMPDGQPNSHSAAGRETFAESAEFVDPGLLSLARKLAPEARPEVSWKALAVIAGLVLLLIVLAVSANS